MTKTAADLIADARRQIREIETGRPPALDRKDWAAAGPRLSIR